MKHSDNAITDQSGMFIIVVWYHIRKRYGRLYKVNGIAAYQWN